MILKLKDDEKMEVIGRMDEMLNIIGNSKDVRYAEQQEEKS